MSFSISESFESRDVITGTTTASTEQIFLVTADLGDSVDENAVKDFLLGGAIPSFFDGLPLVEVRVDNRINAITYKATVRYEGESTDLEEEEEEEEEPTVTTFNTLGGTSHITEGREVVSSGGDVSEQLGAAINWDGDKVQGINITTPVLGTSITAVLPDEQVTADFKNNLHELTGTINIDPFRTFGFHEVLFLGATGSQQEEGGDWDITYNFSSRRSEVDIKVGDFVANKRGWDYLSIIYEKVEDTDAKAIVAKVKSFTVLRVYEESDFSTLGIGVE